MEGRKGKGDDPAFYPVPACSRRGQPKAEGGRGGKVNLVDLLARSNVINPVEDCPFTKRDMIYRFSLFFRYGSGVTRIDWT